ncbi:MAG: ATP-dependent helicase, partial [Candidatus Cloacimonetes bacterium]|nr:ATP-dependent helicase [Candidatus Cloacimonadota bacterium]
MARLFSKDYSDKSTSWYFNHAVIALENGDLWYWKSMDESGNYYLRFFPIPAKRDYFCEHVDIVFDPVSELIISHACSECHEDDSCRHYLSILRYGYLYLSTEIFEAEVVETCGGNALSGDEAWQNLARTAKLYLEGIYNPEADKIRFYHTDFAPYDPVLMGKLHAGEVSDNPKHHINSNYSSNLGAFRDEELRLFHFLNTHRAAYSAKGQFWSLYKKDFAAALSIMQNCRPFFVIKESDEPLSFSPHPYPLSLRIEPAGTKHYILRAVVIDELSVWFAGHPTWLFFRNKFTKIHIPLRSEVIDAIFGSGLTLKPRDLVYYRSIVHRELHEQDIYLDFDPSINLPEIIDEPPRKRLHLKKLGEQVLVGGCLVFPGEKEIPLSVLRFRKPLVHCKYTDDDDGGEAWFHLAPDLFEQTRQLLAKLPEPEMNRLEQHAELVFGGEAKLLKLREAIFDLSDQDWDIRIDEELNREFVAKVPLQVEVIARKEDDIDWFSYDIRYHYQDISFSHEELRRFFKSKDEFLHTAEGRIVFISNPQVFFEVEALINQSELKADNVYRARMINLPYYLKLREENPAFRMKGDEWLEGLFEAL